MYFIRHEMHEYTLTHYFLAKTDNSLFSRAVPEDNPVCTVTFITEPLHSRTDVYAK